MERTTTLITKTKRGKTLPVNLDNSYKGCEVGQRCCEILDVPNIHGWSVVDSNKEEQTALLHYEEDSDKNIYGHIRGLFIDLESGGIIADSFGYTPVSVAQEIKAVDGVLNIRDGEGKTHIFSLQQAIIKRVFEGVIIRVVWRKGVMYRITHRKINASKSRWGSSKNFISMYEEAGGPTAEQLFDTSVPNSSTCYDFLVVDKSLLVASRQVVGTPYIVCISKREMKILRPSGEVATGIASFEVTKEIRGSASGPFIHDPQHLSIDEANLHLRYGYYAAHNPTDFRQLTGEAIIIYKMDGGKIIDSVKVHSPAFEWRTTIRDNNPNINNRFYALLNIAYPQIGSVESWELLKQKLMLFPLYDEEALKDLHTKKGYIFTLPVGNVTRADYEDKEDRIYLLWINYLMSLPMHIQAEALDILSNFNKDRVDLIAWMVKLEQNNKDIEASELHPRIKGIISSTRKLASAKKQSRNVIETTIKNLIYKEAGPSLYSLVREMKKERKLEQEVKQIPGTTLEEIEGKEIRGVILGALEDGTLVELEGPVEPIVPEEDNEGW